MVRPRGDRGTALNLKRLPALQSESSTKKDHADAIDNRLWPPRSYRGSLALVVTFAAADSNDLTGRSSTVL